MAGTIPSLKHALEQSLHELGIERRLKAEQIMLLWPKIVGPAVAKVAYPAQCKNGILFIDVADNIWMQELKFQERDLVGRLNEALGEPLVRRLFLQLARTRPPAPEPLSAAGPAPEPAPLRDTPLDAQQELDLEREVAKVQDPQLREVLKDFRRRLLQRRPSS
jgi:predicted nucleic acid-binding Zn ribbon protein